MPRPAALKDNRSGPKKLFIHSESSPLALHTCTSTSQKEPWHGARCEAQIMPPQSSMVVQTDLFEGLGDLVATQDWRIILGSLKLSKASKRLQGGVVADRAKHGR